ncbi:MAG TPA: hypothetical protein VLH83_11550 [Chthoniobacterales bacterium]|nr:hypothetical protein [Chthoniobacterales bacterium]
MKALFASLLCLVLTATETFALKGGPPYPASTNLVGSFAGVMQGAFDPTTPSSSNSIGVYSIGVPKTGNATGPFVMFARGRVFSGTITATADPTKASIKGVLNATFNYNLSTLVTDSDGTTHIDTIAVTATANGPLISTVSSTKNKSTGTASTIMQGTAVLNIAQGHVAANGDPVIVDILSLTVSGYKQSDTAPTGTGG